MSMEKTKELKRLVQTLHEIKMKHKPRRKYDEFAKIIP